MREGRASETAKGVAASRAMESERPEGIRILHDPLIRKMLGPRFTVIGPSGAPHWLALWLHRLFVPGLHDYVVARARWMDDRVLEAVGAGVAQLVILGAGFDTRAYRLEPLRANVRVFEVDHPASQAEKREALARAVDAIPAHVTFVPVDFHQQSLAERLHAAGYDAQATTLFVMEGVTMYLDPAAVDETLAFVRDRSGRGSSIVFDYTLPEVLSGASRERCAQGLRKIQAKTGEPFRFAIGAGAAGAFLEARGFALRADVDHAALDRTCYSREPRRRSCPVFRIAHAAVVRRDGE